MNEIINNFLLTGDKFTAKMKEIEFVDKPNISNLRKNSELNTKLATLAEKAELKLKQDKILTL